MYSSLILPPAIGNANKRKNIFADFLRMWSEYSAIAQQSAILAFFYFLRKSRYPKQSTVGLERSIKIIPVVVISKRFSKNLQCSEKWFYNF